MGSEQPATTKHRKTFDSAYSFSFAISIGLILFIAGLVISLTMGQGTNVGLLFGIPLIIAGLAVPLIMMRAEFKTNDVSGPCPYCEAPIKTSDATMMLECHGCHQPIVVKDMKLYQTEAK